MKITHSFSHGPVQGFRFGSHPFSKPRLFSHVYFIDGLLVDTGHPKMRKAVLETIGALPVEQIYLTHHHEDHSGNAPQLKAHFNCPVYTSPECIEMMKSPPKISPVQHVIWGDRPPNTDLQPQPLQIQTPNHTFELIFTPGHAVDMYCLYERKEGWLFSADLWVNHYIAYFMRPESMKHQIESLKKVLELDFEVLFCGHNPQFEKGKAKVKKKLHFFEGFYEKAAQLFHEGNPAPAIMKKMGLKERWSTRLLSTGELSTLNMIKAVIRDEGGGE